MPLPDRIPGGTTTTFVSRDGTTALTANWDAGAFDIRAQNLTADALTAGRLVYTGASGLLSAAAAGTWDGSTLGIDGAAVFNESGADKDFRIEGVGAENALFIQGSDGFVGIGTASPGAALHIAGAAGPDVRIDDTGASSDADAVSLFRFYRNSTTQLGYFGYDSSGHAGFSIYNGIASGGIRFYTGGYNERVRITSAGNVGIGTTAPGQILDVNSGSGNMIADGYDSHPSTYAFKENPIEVSGAGMIDKLKSFKLFEFTKKPFVSADEIRTATIKHFSQARWVKAFGGEIVDGEDGTKTIQGDAYRHGKLRTCPDKGMLEFIDTHAEGLREERRGLPQWARKHLGPILDSPGTQEALGDVIHYDEEGNISGYGFNDQVGFLEGCIRELVDRVEMLEARKPSQSNRRIDA